MGRPAKYRRKSIVVDVMGPITHDNAAGIAAWCRGAVTLARDSVLVHTLEGPLIAALGYYVVRGVDDEFHPVRPDIFAKTYERLTSAEPAPPL